MSKRKRLLTDDYPALRAVSVIPVRGRTLADAKVFCPGAHTIGKGKNKENENG